MGGSKSKVEQLNEVVTEMTVESLTRATANCSSNIAMSQVVHVGEGATVAGVTMDQASEINLTCLNDATVSQNMQADLVRKVMNAATNSASAFPAQISKQENVSKISNIMRTRLANTMQQTAESSLNMALTQEQRLTVERGGTAYNVDLRQYAKATGKLVNSLSGEIVSTLVQNTDVSNEATNTTTFFATDMLDSIGSMFSSLFAVAMLPFIIGAIGFVVLGVGGYFVVKAMSGSGKAG